MVAGIRPDFFIMENVPGLSRFAKHKSYLESLIAMLRREGNYVVDHSLLSALELGVPQNRERLFVVGFRLPLVRRSLGRNVEITEDNWFPWPKAVYPSAKSLPWPGVCDFGSNPKPPPGIPLELTVYDALLGRGDAEKAPNGLEFFKPRSSKFRERAEGDVSAKSFKRLHRYRYSPTAWYGNQEVHLHPWKTRRLSVREALRIQSVPEEYVLPEGQSLSAKFKLICNGVPCTMAKSIGQAVLGFLKRAEVAEHDGKAASHANR